jgi:hypothetical protein
MGATLAVAHNNSDAPNDYDLFRAGASPARTILEIEKRQCFYKMVVLLKKDNVGATLAVAHNNSDAPNDYDLFRAGASPARTILEIVFIKWCPY